MSLCNKFGTPLNRKEGIFNSTSLATVMFELNQKFVTHEEADSWKTEFEEKFLDKPEADKLYINEPITENLNMKSKKIENVGEPKSGHHAVNKKYVDKQIAVNKKYVDSQVSKLSTEQIAKVTQLITAERLNAQITQAI